MDTAIHPGLEGVIVAETELSHVDGARGELIIRGKRVEDLAAAADFEAVCGLLWDGCWPDPQRIDTLRYELSQARIMTFGMLGDLGPALRSEDGMDALRIGLAHMLASGDPMKDRTRLVGASAVLAAAWNRVRAGDAPLAPELALCHAEDVLRMATGTGPSPEAVRALQAYLCTVIDHGMNASTFAARVVTSTGSDVVSAVVAAVGALKGPLHGGAPGPVLDMLDAIGTADAATAWLDRELAAGRRIMGMGHRVYRVRDPRAAALELAATLLEQAGGRTPRLTFARAVERAAEELLTKRHPSRALRANVEFYTAVLLEAVGLPARMFSPTFAVARVAGWIAHIEEQRRRGRLIRPAARYVGTVPA